MLYEEGIKYSLEVPAIMDQIPRLCYLTFKCYSEIHLGTTYLRNWYLLALFDCEG